MKKTREQARRRRHLRVRKRFVGTADRPRMCIYRSLKHIYVQVVDDNIDGGGGKTLCAVSTLDKEVAGGGNNSVEMAKKVGQLIARKALEKGIQKVVFDRGGYRYHGRVKSLAEAAREAGLQF